MMFLQMENEMPAFIFGRCVLSFFLRPDYNKLSATRGSAGVILQPGAYVQGGRYFRDHEEEEEEEEGIEADNATDSGPSVFLTNTHTGTAARNAGYQTLSNKTSSSSASHQPSSPTVAMAGGEKVDSSEEDPFDNGDTPPPPPPSAFELVGSAGGLAKSARAWHKDLGKKGIISSSFV